MPFEVFDQPEVRDLDPVADEEQIARFDVEMLEVMTLVHVIERFGGIAQIAQKVVAGDADHAGGLALDEHIVQRPLGQLHDDDELAVDGLDAVERADERMADFADALQRVQLLFSADAFDVE